MEIQIAKSDSEIRECFPVMKELRMNLDVEAFLSTIESAQVDSYKIAFLKKDSQVAAVMGYRILYDFVHGKHLYIDDLVTTKDFRSLGLGAKLLKFAEGEAQKLGCSGIRLCTGIENEAGKRFYERNNWNLRAIVYKKKI